MTADQNSFSYSPGSLSNSAVQPGRKLLSSEDLSWHSLLLEVWEQPGTVEEFTTVPTADQVIVLTSAGQYDIEAFCRGAWKSAHYAPGRGGATAPHNVCQLRWRSIEKSITTLHLYLPQQFLLEVGDEYRRAGASFTVAPVDYLSMSDPFTYEATRALSEGVRLGAPDLYGEATARMLATHLLLQDARLLQANASRDIGDALTDRRLRRVLEFMQHHATEAITLDELAKEAGISRFHFGRLFKRKVGLAPHEYLVQLRLERAAVILRSTDLDVASVAHQCGYPHPGRFAQAFRRAYSLSPSAYRSRSASLKPSSTR